MKLIAIANLSNSNRTIAFRLLDMASKQTKDVPVETIKRAIMQGKITVSNLEIKENDIVGSNGSIDRIPKIISGYLIGKSPLIIINQIGEVGYEVSDFKGTVSNVKTEDAINYANKNGISNGKVVTKDGKEFISAINGSYPTKSLEQIAKENKEVKDKSPYTGELLNSTKRLLPVISPRNGWSISNNRNVITYYQKGEVTTNRDTGVATLELGVDINNIKKDLVYECNGYTIFGCMNQRLNMKNKKDRPKILELLVLDEFRDKIDESIKNKNRKDCNIDKETRIPIPEGKNTYRPIGIEVHTDRGITNNGNVSKSIIEKYLKYLAVMQAYIYVQYIVESKGRLVLSRTCSDSGISYETYDLSDNFYTNQKTETLEDIFYNSKDYDNVIVDGNEMTIRGLDGTYKYDIDVIFKTYNREIVKNNRNIKAAVFDNKYNETVNEIGELKDFRTSSETVHIPKNVKHVLSKSVKLIPSKNTSIIFGSNIETCASNYYEYMEEEGSKQPGYIRPERFIKYIEIGCDPKAAKGILQYMPTSIYSSNLEVHFTRDIIPEEYAKIIKHSNNIKITSSTQNSFSDEFILDIIKRMIPEKSNGFNLIEKPLTMSEVRRNDVVVKITTTRNYRVFLRQFQEFETKWKGLLEPISSSGVKDKINRFISEVREKITFREKEFNDNRQARLRHTR